jgi:hypothetical protein
MIPFLLEKDTSTGFLKGIMLTVRVTIFLAAFLLCFSSAFAQSSLPFAVSVGASNRVQVSSDSTYTFYCEVTNESKSPDTLYFKRSQLLPAAWNTSVCLTPGECYSTGTDSIVFILSPKATLNSSISLSLNVDPSLSNVSDSTIVWLRVGMVGSPLDTMQLPFYISFLPLEPALVFLWNGVTGNGPSFDTSFVGEGSYSISNFLENGFGFGANYFFTIQDSLPEGWSLGTCVRSNYGSSCATGDTLTVNFSDFGDSTYQQEVLFSLNAPNVNKQDSAIIYLGVHPLISTPADSATYRFSMVVMPTGASVATALDTRSGITISNVWPNPLHFGSILHLTVLAGQAGSVTAGIYGLDGTLKGALEFGSLNGGSNDLQISIPDLPSGEYVVRIQQGSNDPEIVRFNYIK